MENTTAFDLNNEILRWQDGLRQLPHFREQDLAELESHLRDSVTGLQVQGLSVEEAFIVATRRLGTPSALEPEFAKVNRSQVWLHRLLWMLIGVQAWALITTLSRLVADGAVIGGAAGFGVNFPRAYPLSAAGFVTTGLFGLGYLLTLGGCVVACWWLIRRKEDSAHQMTVKALQRPVILGIALLVLLAVIGITPMVATRLAVLHYGPEQFAAMQIARSFASMILSALQTLTLVVLTILLFRRRLRLSRI